MSTISEAAFYEIESRIFIVRNFPIMLDSDLASLYGIETKRINEQVRRNAERFPESFMFQLNDIEWKNLRSQFATSNSDAGGRRYLPFAFTEQGVAMLSAVIKSKIAVRISIRIMTAFVEMRKEIFNSAALKYRIETVEKKQDEVDKKFERVFMALEKRDHLPPQGIFFDGQIFDAYKFVSEIIKKANRSIILIDNYVDETTLLMIGKKKEGVAASIYTGNLNRIQKLDIEKYNLQYGNISVHRLINIHDRFLMIDNKELYHIGASLKDLGKKIFAFSRMDPQINFLEWLIQKNKV